MSKQLLEHRMCAVNDGVLFCAFRYALGRRTYVVSEVCEDIRMNISNISQKIARLIVKEIDEASSLGDDMDKKQWLMVRGLLQKKLGNSDDNKIWDHD